MKNETLKEQVGIKINKDAYIIDAQNSSKYINAHMSRVDFDKSFANVTAKEFDKMIIDDLKENSIKIEGNDILELSELAIQKIYNKTKRFMPNLLMTKDKKLVKGISGNYDKVVEYKELEENEFLFIVNEPDLLITPIYYNDSGMMIDYKYNKDLVVYGILKK